MKRHLTRKDLRILSALAIAVFVVAACDDDGPTADDLPLIEPQEFAVVVNSIDISITYFRVDDPAGARTIGLAPAGSPVTAAGRGKLVVVPLGFFPAAAVIDLVSDSVWTVPLPDNSGATGVAFWDDTVAYVANPNRNSVTPIDVTAGTAGGEIDVGVFPQAVVASKSHIFVLNAELDANFQPAREGRISVIDPASNTVIDTIVLSGFNPSAAALGPVDRLYVINSGSFGQGNGSLSVVDVLGLKEVEHHTGFGEFPGDIAVGGDGRIYVSAFAYGVAVWDAVADSFIHPPDDPLVVQGNSISSGIGLDADGRLYTLIPGDCSAAGVALRVNPDLSFDREVPVGVCPIAIEFTDVLK